MKADGPGAGHRSSMVPVSDASRAGNEGAQSVADGKADVTPPKVQPRGSVFQQLRGSIMGPRASALIGPPVDRKAPDPNWPSPQARSYLKLRDSLDAHFLLDTKSHRGLLEKVHRQGGSEQFSASEKGMAEALRKAAPHLQPAAARFEKLLEDCLQQYIDGARTPPNGHSRERLLDFNYQKQTAFNHYVLARFNEALSSRELTLQELPAFRKFFRQEAIAAMRGADFSVEDLATQVPTKVTAAVNRALWKALGTFAARDREDVQRLDEVPMRARLQRDTLAKLETLQASLEATTLRGDDSVLQAMRRLKAAKPESPAFVDTFHEAENARVYGESLLQRAPMHDAFKARFLAQLERAAGIGLDLFTGEAVEAPEGDLDAQLAHAMARHLFLGGQTVKSLSGPAQTAALVTAWDEVVLELRGGQAAGMGAAEEAAVIERLARKLGVTPVGQPPQAPVQPEGKGDTQVKARGGSGVGDASS